MRGSRRSSCSPTSPLSWPVRSASTNGHCLGASSIDCADTSRMKPATCTTKECHPTMTLCSGKTVAYYGSSLTSGRKRPASLTIASSPTFPRATKVQISSSTTASRCRNLPEKRFAAVPTGSASALWTLYPRRSVCLTLRVYSSMATPSGTTPPHLQESCCRSARLHVKRQWSKQH